MPATPPTHRSPAVEALLAQVVDYAGLFPPAGLDMGPTVRNYAAYVDCDESWMLGRLIVPVARLDEMEAEAAGRLPTDPDDEPWHLSALTVPAGDPGLAADLERIGRFNARHEDPAAGLARIDVIELRATSVAGVESALELLPDELFPFFEMPVDSDPRGLLAALVGSDGGAKVRTGGLEARMVPATDHLARFIAAAAGARVPIKATAGMHHPVRHHAQAIGAMEFGFLNVFVAATLAWHGGVDERQLAEMLNEERAEAFRFDEDGAAWAGRRLGVAEIARARQQFAVSFGSCSFDEPREDLRALGLI
ncbi:MAG: hypothetical protein ACYTJ0_07005 [Planctomycetota bacterium]|jgi:hypothetical protein